MLKQHDRRGIVSMANRGPHTNGNKFLSLVTIPIYFVPVLGSQFFFVYDKQPHLDNVNTVFGRYFVGVKLLVFFICSFLILLVWLSFRRIIHGLDVLDSMETIKSDEKDRPEHPIKIESVKIHANPIAETPDA